MNLARYGGNFLSFADQEFTFCGGATKQFNQRKGDPLIDTLKIEVSCSVGVFPTSKEAVLVEVDTDTPENFDIRQSGSAVVIKQKSTGCGSVNVINSIFGGGTRTVVSGNNVVMVNGEVWIDGKKVNPNDQQSREYPHKIRIYLPSSVDVEATLKGASVFASKVIFEEADIDLSGVATIGLAAKSLRLDLSGQGESYAVVKGGTLKADISGQGKVRVKGEYSEVDASVSGMGSVVTEGACRDGYRASVSGMGSISHQGTIAGRVKKSLSGMGSINI